MAQPDQAVKERFKTNTSIKAPSKYKVIYINDSVTTMEFVVESLVNVFNHSYARAAELTEQVHEEGAAVVAVLPYELAEQKGIEVTMNARAEGFPLVLKLESED